MTNHNIGQTKTKLSQSSLVLKEIKNKFVFSHILSYDCPSKKITYTKQTQ